ncbi:MAG: hypothetical protein AAGU76_02005 [Sedimentibacter sp.]|uniref:hypothetical protein n=1 Tax=Sedimentibacter sp. TaxID=1960295 RepID=UPI003158F464
MILYFISAVPKDDNTLSVQFSDSSNVEFPIGSLLVQFRFSPLKDKKVWEKVEVFPTHLEWNSGTFQVNLNIEEIVPNYNFIKLWEGGKYV